MSKPGSDHRAAMLRLAEKLAEDILALSDDEIASEFSDKDELVLSERVGLSILDKARKVVARKKYLEAKAAVQAEKQKLKTPSIKSADRARQRLDRALSSDPNLLSRMTLAARKSKGQNNADVIDIVDDLEELGLIPPETISDA